MEERAEREIEAVEERYEDGEITLEERNILIREIEKDMAEMGY